jgi:hypothetical protein
MKPGYKQTEVGVILEDGCGGMIGNLAYITMAHIVSSAMVAKMAQICLGRVDGCLCPEANFLHHLLVQYL